VAWMVASCGRSSPAAPTATAEPTATAMVAALASPGSPAPSAAPSPSSSVPSPQPRHCRPHPRLRRRSYSLPNAVWNAPQRRSGAPVAGWRLDANSHLTSAAVNRSCEGDEGRKPDDRPGFSLAGRTVYAVDRDGKAAWQARVPGPIYALALSMPEDQPSSLAVAGDNGVTLAQHARAPAVARDLARASLPWNRARPAVGKMPGCWPVGG